MSTQAIRRTLEELKDRLEDSRSEFFSRDQTAQDERRLEDASEALAEVEAIERAAKDLDDNLVAQVFASNPEKVQAALDLMAKIAEGAK